MKVTITKVPDGKVQVTLETNPSGKPISFAIEPGQVPLLASMLQLAVTADRFNFSLEM